MTSSNPWTIPFSIKGVGYSVQMSNLSMSAFCAAAIALAGKYVSSGGGEATVQSAEELGLGLLKELGSLGLLTLVLWKIGPGIIRAAAESHRVEMVSMANAVKDLRDELGQMRQTAQETNRQITALIWAIDPTAGRMATRKRQVDDPPQGT